MGRGCRIPRFPRGPAERRRRRSSGLSSADAVHQRPDDRRCVPSTDPRNTPMRRTAILVPYVHESEDRPRRRDEPYAEACVLSRAGGSSRVVWWHRGLGHRNLSEISSPSRRRDEPPPQAERDDAVPFVPANACRHLHSPRAFPSPRARVEHDRAHREPARRAAAAAAMTAISAAHGMASIRPAVDEPIGAGIGEFIVARVSVGAPASARSVS